MRIDTIECVTSILDLLTQGHKNMLNDERCGNFQQNRFSGLFKHPLVLIFNVPLIVTNSNYNLTSMNIKKHTNIIIKMTELLLMIPPSRHIIVILSTYNPLYHYTLHSNVFKYPKHIIFSTQFHLTTQRIHTK